MKQKIRRLGLVGLTATLLTGCFGPDKEFIILNSPVVDGYDIKVEIYEEDDSNLQNVSIGNYSINKEAFIGSHLLINDFQADNNFDIMAFYGDNLDHKLKTYSLKEIDDIYHELMNDELSKVPEP